MGSHTESEGIRSWSMIYLVSKYILWDTRKRQRRMERISSFSPVRIDEIWLSPSLHSTCSFVTLFWERSCRVKRRIVRTVQPQAQFKEKEKTLEIHSWFDSALWIFKDALDLWYPESLKRSQVSLIFSLVQKRSSEDIRRDSTSVLFLDWDRMREGTNTQGKQKGYISRMELTIPTVFLTFARSFCFSNHLKWERNGNAHSELAILLRRSVHFCRNLSHGHKFGHRSCG